MNKTVLAFKMKNYSSYSIITAVVDHKINVKAQIPLSHLLTVCIWLPLKVGSTHSADILCNVFWVPCLRALLHFFSQPGKVQRARAVSWIKRHRNITDTAT